jgi:hypothetical protein
MKRLGLVIMAVLLLSLAGCGLPQNVKTQKQEALKIAQSIPLPPSFYSSDTGHQMVARPIEVEFMGTYSTETGEPIFSVSFEYTDPHPNWLHNGFFGMFSQYVLPCREYDLRFPVATQPVQSVGEMWSFGSDGHYNSFEREFTLQSLQSHASELEWN